MQPTPPPSPVGNTASNSSALVPETPQSTPTLLTYGFSLPQLLARTLHSPEPLATLSTVEWDTSITSSQRHSPSQAIAPRLPSTDIDHSQQLVPFEASFPAPLQTGESVPQSHPYIYSMELAQQPIETITPPPEPVTPPPPVKGSARRDRKVSFVVPDMPPMKERSAAVIRSMDQNQAVVSLEGNPLHGLAPPSSTWATNGTGSRVLVSPPPFALVCVICHQVSTDAQKAEEHYASEHGQPRPYACNGGCGFSFETERQRKMHLLRSLACRQAHSIAASQTDVDAGSPM